MLCTQKNGHTAVGECICMPLHGSVRMPIVKGEPLADVRCALLGLLFYKGFTEISAFYPSEKRYIACG